MRPVVLLACLVASGCASAARPTPPLPPLPFAADSVREQQLARGATRRFIYAPSGPWAIHVLDVDVRCFRPVAVKGAVGAIGREKTSTLLDRLRDARVVGGVNADFFLFAPPGVPRGAHIEHGRVITGPARDPALTIDSLGVARVEVLGIQGTITAANRRFRLANWNRIANAGLALFDANWGARTDTASSTIEVAVSGTPTRVTAIDTTVAGVAIPFDGAVVIAGRAASDSVRDALLALRPGDTVSLSVSITPRHPRDAVGGRPRLVRDSAIVSDVDSVGGAGFATTRHPRTAVGIRADGRVLLVVVDGRQKPYSDGMTLRELANLMLALGARDAINLDGGGSTTLVYVDAPRNGSLRVANKPSDQQGERAVGNALGVISVCN